MTLLLVICGCQTSRRTLEGQAIASLQLTTKSGKATIKPGESVKLELVATLPDGSAYSTGNRASRRASFLDFRLQTDAGNVDAKDGVLIVNNVSATMLGKDGVVVTAVPRWAAEPKAELRLSLDVTSDVRMDYRGANGKDGRNGSFSGGDGGDGTPGVAGPKLDLHVSSVDMAGKSYLRVQVLDRDEKQDNRLILVERGKAKVTIDARGGRGGDGGRGGMGHRGWNAKEEGRRGGRGGRGGDGGDGGAGGRGGMVYVTADSPDLADHLIIMVDGGAGGLAGRAGRGGPGGRGNKAPNGSNGFSGFSGSRGKSGIGGGIEEVKP